MKKIIAALFVLTASTSLFSYEPIFYVNDTPAGYNYTVKDFYVYDYSENYFEAFARLHYSGPSWRESVKMTVSFFKDGVMTGSESSYIDYMTYGYDGMWPGSDTYMDYFFNKVDFDSVYFTVSYSTRDGKPKFNKNAMSIISTSIELNPGSISKVSGIAQNMSGVILKSPTVFICVYRADRMIMHKYTYLDAPDYQLEPLQSASFDTYMELPAQYDSIKYLPNYNVSTTGNIIISGIKGITENLTVEGFSLSQNYPNPFNASTTLQFSVDRPQRIKMEIYDLMGKFELSAFDGILSNGHHSITINAEGLSSGSYFYVLTGENQRLTKKMTVLK